MSSHYVYVIVNKINLKLYFGSHSWEGDGPDPNYYGSGKIIKQAIKKYGRDNFIIQPIKFYSNVEECRKAEEELLKKYDIANNQYCYNLKNSAMGGDKGRKLSEDTKRKMSQAQKGENSYMYGKHHTENTKRKMSESKKGEKHPMYGKHHTEDTKRKMSQAQKGRTLSDATRQKMSQSKKDIMNPIVAIDKNGKVKIFESQKECSRVLGVSPGNVNDCLKGRQKTCKGYTFKYLEQLESGIYEGITGIAE